MKHPATRLSKAATAAVIALSSTAVCAADFRAVWQGHTYYTCDVRPVDASHKDPRWVYVGHDLVTQRNFYAQTVFVLKEKAGLNRPSKYVIFDPIVQECALRSTGITESQRPIHTSRCDPAHVNGPTMFHEIVGGFRGNDFAITGQQFWSNYLADRSGGRLNFRNIAGQKSTLFYLQNCRDNTGRGVSHPPL